MMAGHTVASYDEDLKALDSKIRRMGVLAEQQLAAALGAVAEGNPERASQAIAGDAAIDLMQSEVEDWGGRILAMRQPVAIDLRNIIGAMRIAGDLERIGDMAKNIGKGITSFDQSAWASPMTKSLCAMGETALLQLEAVLDSYAKRDPELALNVWMRDQEIDQQYDSLFRELLTYMMEDPKTISYAANLLFCAKNIERVGDHCTNIAESVSYIVTGQTIADGRPTHGTNL
jgi:phosphate transport system protein